MPIRETALRASLCRQVDSGPCLPVPASETAASAFVPVGGTQPVHWTDTLPAALDEGAPRLLAYRVELLNRAGKTAGSSDVAFAAAGAPPPPVGGLIADGTRLGVELRWTGVPEGGEVLLERSEPETAAAAQGPRPVPLRGRTAKLHGSPRASSSRPDAQPGVLWLQAAPGDRSAAATMDAGVAEDVPYTYRAFRREVVKLGSRTLQLRSAASAPVTIAWHDVYPPAAPRGLTALGYMAPLPPQAPQSVPGYAVDLVWQPVNDPRLAGYIVSREALSPSGAAVGPRLRLTPQPIPAPAFHDASARAAARYRYRVTAIDPRGNESPAATAIVEPLVNP